MRRIPIPTVLTAAGLVLLLLIYAVTFQVRFNDAAVKVRFGQVEDRGVLLGSNPGQVGLHFKWPPPIETVRLFDMRLRTLETPEGEVKTRDGHNLIVGCFALWKIKDPLQYSKRVSRDAVAIEQLRARVNEARAVVMGGHNMADFINLDGELVEKNNSQIEQEMLATAGKGVEADYGIELVRVAIRRISLPAEAAQKVQEAMIAERNRMASRFETEGRSAAASIKAAAEAAKQTILSFADRKAKEIESAGVQASTRIFAQIDQQDQEFFIWLRWLEALEVSLRTKATIFLDWNTDMFKNFAAPPTAQTPAARVGAVPTGEVTPRSAPQGAGHGRE